MKPAAMYIAAGIGATVLAVVVALVVVYKRPPKTVADLFRGKTVPDAEPSKAGWQRPDNVGAASSEAGEA